jgi:exodeoxyribonuclease V alpha subunit
VVVGDVDEALMHRPRARLRQARDGRARRRVRPEPAGCSSRWRGAPPTPEREALAGLVERVTFHSPESGFCVLRVKVRGHRELVTVGAAAAITAGEFVQASGSWVNDRTHGLQFRAAFLRTAPPTTLEGIERYLGSGMVKGIGPVYAGRLVAAFGEGVFDVIEASPGACGRWAGSGRSGPGAS